MNNLSKKQISGFFSLLILETILVAVYLLALPRDVKNSVLFGYSFQRLAMVGFLLGFALIFIVVFVQSIKNSQKFTAWLTKLLQSAQSYWLIALLALIFAVTFLISNYPRTLVEDTLKAYYDRLLPLMIWASILSGESIIALILTKQGDHTEIKSEIRKYGLPTALVLVGLLVIAGFSFFTKLGLTPDPISWRQMGSPLLVWQVGVALLVAGILLLAENRWSAFFEKHKTLIEGGMLLLIYAGALVLWLQKPIMPAYTAPRVTPPNYEIYPYSDAMYYSAAAESVLTGNGLYGWSVVPRPFFISILAFMIGFAQGKYENVIVFQTILLAFIPVLMYLIGKRLSSRSLGLALALIAIFREVDAIDATPFLQVSHSKLILSDTPTLLIFLIFTYLLIVWMQDHIHDRRWAFYTGGVLGIVVLFRTQAAIVLPLIWIAFRFLAGMNWRKWLIACTFFLLGIGTVVSPWVIRNYVITGQLVFDDSQTQTDLLSARYQIGAEDTEGNANSSIVQAILQHPREVAAFVTNHFLRNEICILFVNPPINLFDTVDAALTSYPFWKDDTIAFTPIQGIQFTGYLAVIAIGLVAQWKRNRITGLMPLILQFGYTASNALARNSGGRYNLPVDWCFNFYFASGVVLLIGWFFCIKHTSDHIPEQKQTAPRSRYSLAFSVGVIILCGLFIPLTELLFSPRYKSLSRTDLASTLTEWKLSDQQITDILGMDSEEILFGRELYPRFYLPDVGEQGSNWVAYSPQDYPRMGFLVMSFDGMHQVILSTASAPEGFVNRADVIVLGTPNQGSVRDKMVDFVDADMIIMKTDSGAKIFIPEKTAP